jgi:internalin A
VLHLEGARVADLSPVRKLRRLEKLTLSNDRLVDLRPLKGLKLELLWLNDCPVTDLMPLEGMALTDVSLANTKVRDLTPLKDAPLTILDLRSMSVADWSLLRKMPLERLRADEAQLREHRTLLQAIPTLKFINEKAAEQVWKDLDSRKPE